MNWTRKQQQENATKWIEALLSNEYIQTTRVLGNLKDGFCCWGLGCFVTQIPYKSWDSWDSVLAKATGYLWENGAITPSYIIEGKEIEHLSTLNDETGATFKDIALYLIKNANTNFEDHVAESIKKHFADTISSITDSTSSTGNL